jgi:hypothetical protein
MVSVGKYEKKAMWVQVGGLLFSYFEKPDVKITLPSLQLFFLYF